MPTVLIGTRKGLLVMRGEADPWSIAPPLFAGEPVTQVLADARDGAWYCALRMGHFGVKLRRSRDQGASWTDIAAPAFPAKPETGPLADDPTPWSVDLIWSLAAGGTDAPGELWAGCIPAGLFHSRDAGDSWQLVSGLWEVPTRKSWMGGGYDHAGIHSVLVDPRDARHLTVAISCGGVWQTHDRGDSWQLTSQGMRSDFVPAEIADDGNIQDPHCLVQCAADPDVLWVQHHGGIYRSEDGGRQWLAIPDPQPSGFGFAVASDPKNAQRAWFVPAQADAVRIPVGGCMQVTRTDDGGRSFRSFGEGLPDRDAYHLVYRHALDVDASGRKLVMASTTGGLWTSQDAGENWQVVSRDLPPVAAVRFVP